jgi:T-complex protein 1 subunit gamma
MGGLFYGIEGKYGKICDMRKLGIFEPCSMKNQIFKTAIENAIMIMRVDKILYGLTEKSKKSSKIDKQSFTDFQKV